MIQQPLRTVVVLGTSYGGCNASKLLADGLPPNYRLIAIDRNTHFNHVYAFPRYTTMPQHAPKGFIPYKHMLDPQPPAPSDPLTPPQTPPAEAATLPDDQQKLLAARSRHQFIQACAVKLSANSVTIVRPTGDGKATEGQTSRSKGNMTYGEFDGPEETIHFDYLLYALGAALPGPVNAWQTVDRAAVGDERRLGTKKCGLRFMKLQHDKFEKAERILIVGGGALGIEYAGDLKYLWPDKKITLLHSRTRMMPRYDIELHLQVVEHLAKLGVEVVLGERVMTWPDEPEILDGKPKIVTTDKGRTFEADLVLPCTGQKAHVSLMAEVDPSLISAATGRIFVLPTQQVHSGPIPSSAIDSTAEQLSKLNFTAPLTPPSSAASIATDSADGSTAPDYSHIFAIGDCAETSAIQAGHTAYWMGEVAVRNMLRLIDRREGGPKKDEVFEHYKPGPPAIKLTLGIVDAVIANGEGVNPNKEGVEDMHSMVMWPVLNAEGMDVME
ncbi:hypothetical protein B9479_002722 [Cryptococcus floricola]|uniref:FAD/NAD(P)-binding domain-containing protein n=1 Tax=Cryptococcus floricola TaxID=2591691 RepID=A0A5D3B2Y8_9TREE|nr:hypothetical protein B9479_002722 [Cryptococcus floricola]